MDNHDFLTSDEIRSLVPIRSEKAHKGTCGRLLIVAGSSTMMGAALLCAKAAFRSGVGMVYLASGSSFVHQLVLELPELIVLPLTEESGNYGAMALEELKSYISKYEFSSVLIGPGLGQDKATKVMIKSFSCIVAERGIAGVIDADAFYALDPELFVSFPMNSYVLTPHPKEFSVFSGLTYSDDQRQLLSENLAQSIQQIIVLKGHQSIITYAGTSVINPTGNSGMATAGSGDVLSGIIAGFIGQGVMACDAAYLGVYLHGLAGDIAASLLGEHSVLASDLIDRFPSALKEVMK